jgi:hypothetical protein
MMDKREREIERETCVDQGRYVIPYSFFPFKEIKRDDVVSGTGVYEC